MAKNICILVSLLLILPSICGQQSGLRPTTFTYYNAMMNWTAAQSFCRKHHTDLVTIRSEKDDQVFYWGSGWIGLYQKEDGGPWKWSRGDETANRANWDPDQPDEYGHCAFKNYGTIRWRNDHCHDKHTFICYDEKLVLVKDNKTWEEALEHCRSLGEVGSYYDLVTLTSPDDHEYAQERAQHATTEEVWMGLRYLGDEWFWVTGEEVWYQDIPSCPAVTCGVLEKSNNTAFGMRDCNQRRNFFCYKRS